MKRVDFLEIEGKSGGFFLLLGALGALLIAALGSAYFMEHNGHVVTGMNNQIVWGIPHVFAVFLIVAASGAINVASVSSVFKKPAYKPLAPLSGLLAMGLLAGGLAVLVLDLGRPDRLIVAMTHYNFKSIFAWNIFLYTGFMAVVFVYLWMMMERRFNKYSRPAGITAFIWRLMLTTGTGSIFGFLVARQAYDAAIMAPMFIIMSLAFGTAIYILVLMAAYKWTGRELGQFVLSKLRSLLGIFIAAVFLIVATYHLTNLYVAENAGVESFILFDGNVYTYMFWLGQILIGTALPLALIFSPQLKTSNNALVYASIFTIVGGLAQLYVIIIGGQAFPMDIFPGYEVTSSFFDGQIGMYNPSIPEIMLGVGGIAIAGLIVTIGVKLLKFLPANLSDNAVDPHHKG
ncbi:MAG: polysulfide reductase NrfD [Gammaproteobacteria bacterium]|nr:polysulfide reductase NrfD [Gammaproteobacteria bacterium]